VKIKGTTIEGSHSIFIENWRSTGVVDVESTIVRSGLIFDLFDSRQDLVNGEPSYIDLPILPWNIISNSGLGISGNNTAPDRFTLWRNNLTGLSTSQSSAINNLFFYNGL
jgi:hypothetical protein